jgi:hypothetical protein
MGNTTNALEKLLAKVNKKLQCCIESSLFRPLEITCGSYRYAEGITMKEFVPSTSQVTFVILRCIKHAYL